VFFVGATYEIRGNKRVEVSTTGHEKDSLTGWLSSVAVKAVGEGGKEEWIIQLQKLYKNKTKNPKKISLSLLSSLVDGVLPDAVEPPLCRGCHGDPGVAYVDY